MRRIVKRVKAICCRRTTRGHVSANTQAPGCTERDRVFLVSRSPRQAETVALQLYSARASSLELIGRILILVTRARETASALRRMTHPQEIRSVKLVAPLQFCSCFCSVQQFCSHSTVMFGELLLRREWRHTSFNW